MGSTPQDVVFHLDMALDIAPGTDRNEGTGEEPWMFISTVCKD